MEFLPLPAQCTLLRKWLRRSARIDGRNVTVEALVDGEVILAFDGRVSHDLDLNDFVLLDHIDMVRISRSRRSLRVYPKDKTASTSHGFRAYLGLFEPLDSWDWTCDDDVIVGMTPQECSDLVEKLWFDWLAG